MLLTIPPSRRTWEAARALEIQEADQALQRSRRRWFAIGMVAVFAGDLPMALSFHTSNEETGNIFFWTSILLSDVGPMVVLYLAATDEE